MQEDSSNQNRAGTEEAASNGYRRVLVTGGCGFVGTEVVSLLLAKGHQVVVADDLSNPQSQAKSGYDSLRVDVGDPDAARAAFKGVDACIAMASRRGAIGYAHRNPTDIITGNSRIYDGTFRAAAEAGVRRLVFVSSSTVYENARIFPTRERDIATIPTPKSVFGFSKLIGEGYCRAFWQEFSLPYTIVRPSNVYGINEVAEDKVGDSHVIPELFKKVASGQHPVELLGDGRQTRSFVHTTDLARGIVTALESDHAANEDFNMGGTEEIQILDLAEMIQELCGKTGEFEVSHTEGFPNDVRRQFLDTAKAQTMLGWRPQVSFKDGLREVVDWLLARF